MAPEEDGNIAPPVPYVGSMRISPAKYWLRRIRRRVQSLAKSMESRMTRFLFVQALALAALALSVGCFSSSEPKTCAEADCEPDIEFCRFFGSDTLEPPTASCAAFPDACAATKTCECLVDEESFPAARCDTDGELLVVTIPAG